MKNGRIDFKIVVIIILIITNLISINELTRAQYSRHLAMTMLSITKTRMNDLLNEGILDYDEETKYLESQNFYEIQNKFNNYLY